MTERTEEVTHLSHGWYVVLGGDESDLEDWRYVLNEPFDPVAVKDQKERKILYSRQFENCRTAEEVRSRALVIISRLNGAMAMSNGTRPVQLANVLQIDEDENEKSHVFAEMSAIELFRVKVRATATVLGPDGEPVPPPPPQASPPQTWNDLAEANEDVSDLLSELGKAESWIDLYKVLEVATVIMGSRNALYALCDGQESKFRDLQRTANFHRHARGHSLPGNPPTLREATSLTKWLVSRVLEHVKAANDDEA